MEDLEGGFGGGESLLGIGAGLGGSWDWSLMREWHSISITPEGLIRMPHTKYPAQLSVQIHNVISGMYAGGWILD